MSYQRLLMVILAVFALAGWAAADSPYIYGVHDGVSGCTDDMTSMGTKGYVLDAEAIGHDPNNYSGTDYTGLANAGFTVLGRIDHSYDPAVGGFPYQVNYPQFAQRCANYVNASPGCHIWIIGNEPNLCYEWPGNVNGDPNTGEPVTSSAFVSCYTQCYNAIKALPGHSSDWVMPGAIGTWGPPLPAQNIEGFDAYFKNSLNGIGASKVQGICLHVYTHGTGANLVTDQTLMGSPYTYVHYNFQVYRDYMSWVPSGFTSLPVYFGECGEFNAWANTDNGWVKNAYSEVNSWNGSHSQKIRALCMYRYANYDSMHFGDLGGVRQDWREAMSYHYQWGTSNGSIAGTVKNSGGAGISGALVSTSTGGYSTVTDASGNYTLNNVTPGSYNVTAIATYYVQQTNSNVGVTSGSQTNSNFTLPSNGINGNTPSGTNNALNASYQDDSEYSSSYNGAKALDGSLSTKWCTTSTSQTHWLTVDLGATRTVNGYIIQMASAGGETTLSNLKLFQVQSGTSMTGPWSDETDVYNASQIGTINLSYGTGKSLRYIRLYVTNDGADNYCRLYEFQVMCTATGGTGTISGTIKDGSANNLSGATVSTNTGGYQATTNSSGSYTLSNVAVGTYTVSAALSGFATGSNSNVSVTSGNTTTSNFTLVPNGMNSNTPTGTNLSLSFASYTDDSEYGSSYAGAKALDGLLTDKWCSTATTQTHWLAVDLGADQTVNGFVLQHAGAGGEYTTENLKNYAVQSGTSISGPWQDDVEVNNSAQANSTANSYITPKVLRYVRLYVTNDGIDNYCRLYEFNILGSGGGWGGVSENFDALPTWASIYDASWGNAAAWSDVTGGQSGNCLQVVRSGQGSSDVCLDYTVPTNTNITISLWMKCPNYTGGTYWMESAYKFGNNSAQDFDTNSSTWTYINKFSNTGTNGNSNTWTQYSATVNTGVNTQITIGYKLGAQSCNGPTVYWDTFSIH